MSEEQMSLILDVSYSFDPVIHFNHWHVDWLPPDMHLTDAHALSHVVKDRLIARYPQIADAIIHIDETHAVKPLERISIWDEGELPETYPFQV